MYTEKISLIEDDAEDAGAAAGVPDWEMSEEFLDHAKARHLLCNYRTTSTDSTMGTIVTALAILIIVYLATLAIVAIGCTCHAHLHAV